MAKIVCAAFIEDHRILLVRRAPHRKWSPNRWDLVGGHVDKGERLDIALVRECEEEVGLTPLHYQHVETIFEETDPLQKTPFHVYAIRLWRGGAPQLLGDEHSELGWFTLQDAESIDFALEGYRPIFRQLLSGFQPAVQSVQPSAK